MVSFTQDEDKLTKLWDMMSNKNRQKILAQMESLVGEQECFVSYGWAGTECTCVNVRGFDTVEEATKDVLTKFGICTGITIKDKSGTVLRFFRWHAEDERERLTPEQLENVYTKDGAPGYWEEEPIDRSYVSVPSEF